jgi:hypothetical protein
MDSTPLIKEQLAELVMRNSVRADTILGIEIRVCEWLPDNIALFGSTQEPAKATWLKLSEK